MKAPAASSRTVANRTTTAGEYTRGRCTHRTGTPGVRASSARASGARTTVHDYMTPKHAWGCTHQEYATKPRGQRRPKCRGAAPHPAPHPCRQHRRHQHLQRKRHHGVMCRPQPHRWSAFQTVFSPLCLTTLRLTRAPAWPSARPSGHLPGWSAARASPGSTSIPSVPHDCRSRLPSHRPDSGPKPIPPDHSMHQGWQTPLGSNRINAVPPLPHPSQQHPPLQRTRTATGPLTASPQPRPTAQPTDPPDSRNVGMWPTVFLCRAARTPADPVEGSSTAHTVRRP
jgi:hypothetical protein